MAKRKRTDTPVASEPAAAAAAAAAAPAAVTKAQTTTTTKKQKATTAKTESAKPAAATTASTIKTSGSKTETIQIVVGFYDGVLHGFTGTIKSAAEGSKNSDRDKKKKKKTERKEKEKNRTKKDEDEDDDEDERRMEFADTFLLTAHTKSIRCLAISPPSTGKAGQGQKRILASGSSDSKINLYELTAHTAPARARAEEEADPTASLMRHLAPRPIAEDRRNRELGSLEHHASAVTALSFPLRSKLMSASEDATVAVTRTRDWALLSTLRAPMVKAEGRPSGDTAAFDGTPQGVNDFALHPSMKLMMTASKGEKKVRPWNLTTGKRAKALGYGRHLLQQVGESRHASGEAQKLAFGDDEFAVGFDRDVVVFGVDGNPKCLVLGGAKPSGTKVHQVRYHSVGGGDGDDKTAAAAAAAAAGEARSLLAVSTEDGRIVIVSTADEHITPLEDVKDGMAPGAARTVAQVGGRAEGVGSRIKDFVLVRGSDDGDNATLYAIGGGSDGVVRVWALGVDELRGVVADGEAEPVKGRLVGTYRTDNRIMCMAAYLMTPNDDVEDDDGVFLDEDEDGDSDDEE